MLELLIGGCIYQLPWQSLLLQCVRFNPNGKLGDAT
jgi:hypothetical protein